MIIDWQGFGPSLPWATTQILPSPISMVVPPGHLWLHQQQRCQASEIIKPSETIWRRLNCIGRPKIWRGPSRGFPCLAFVGETFVADHLEVSHLERTIWRRKIWRGPLGDVSLGGEAFGGVKCWREDWEASIWGRVRDTRSHCSSCWRHYLHASLPLCQYLQQTDLFVTNKDISNCFKQTQNTKYVNINF